MRLTRTSAAGWPTGSTCRSGGSRARAPASGGANARRTARDAARGLARGPRRAGRCPRRRRRRDGSADSRRRLAADAAGGFAVYGRTDQLLAGLERAVDPNSDGSVARRRPGRGRRRHRAVRRLRRRASRPRDLGRGPAGHARRRPGGQRGARGSGIRQHRRSRRRAGRAHRRCRGSAPGDGERARRATGGSACPARPRGAAGRGGGATHGATLTVVRPRRDVGSGPRSAPLGRYFDQRGFSVVAGKATLLARAEGLPDSVRGAAAAGTAAILVDGLVPAGALGLDDRVDVPVVGVPTAVAAAARSALARGVDVSVSLGAAGWSANARRARIAPFSSTASPSAAGSSPSWRPPASSSSRLIPAGTRIARHATDRSAARVQRQRSSAVRRRRWRRCAPDLDAFALKGALVGTAAPIRGGAPAAQGAGMVDAAAASAAEAVSEPTTISFGAADEAGWTAVRRIAVRNISSRRIDVDVIARVAGHRRRLRDGRPAARPPSARSSGRT